MDLKTPDQFLAGMKTHAYLAPLLPQAIIVQIVSSAEEMPCLDLFLPGGWRHRQFAVEFPSLVDTVLLPRLTDSDEVHLILLCEVLPKRRKQSGEYLLQTSKSGSSTIVMRVLAELLRHPALDTFVRTHPDRLDIVLMAGGTIEIASEKIQWMLPFIRATGKPIPSPPVTDDQTPSDL